MKSIITTLLSLAALAFAPALPAAEETTAWSAVYEEVTYTFESEVDLNTFKKERSESLYHRLGGKAAINAAVDLFYTKVLADNRVNFIFENVNMARQHRQQKAFLSAALGSPVAYTGKDMRAAHATLDLTEEDFAAIAEHLQATLVELEVDEKLIAETMAIVASTKDDVLGR
jgi:hemoglobin